MEKRKEKEMMWWDWGEGERIIYLLTATPSDCISHSHFFLVFFTLEISGETELKVKARLELVATEQQYVLNQNRFLAYLCHVSI